ncbi:UDP-N-acetylmuramoyl-L-alanyl-D-glutamate--2,6-diaminopimelate ligase [bacterium]|nr:UDP-N-acetylmuramoyl-L-alanyl-D-glutamate--2,6-diaminopimelate ligase [bacterium]
MKLENLLQGIEIIKSSGDLSREICGISHNSRDIKPGFLFVALKGKNYDGHDFISEAIGNGATAIVLEDESKLPQTNLPIILVPSSRKALAELSTRFYDYPSRKLKLIGVTGTNGKGLTCHLAYHIFRAYGYNSAYLGTLGAHLNSENLPWTTKTTPEPEVIQETLSKIVKQKGEIVLMEVSSHSIAQYRNWGCEFDAMVFTNLSQDHLDYHETMESYFQTKLRLFTIYPQHSSKKSTAIINIDDPYGKRLLKQISLSYITYGTSHSATVRGYLLEQDFSYLLFHLVTPTGETDIRLPLGGVFNLYNALAASAIAYTFDVPLEIIKKGLESVSPLPGRFEVIDEGQNFPVIVDYAHTPEGIEELLSSVVPIAKGKKIILFGCGGDRDRGKRPIMGKIAVQLADLAIITSDNPRSEEPSKIIEEILSGVPQDKMDQVIVEPDREKAIRLAIEVAQKGDCVLIAGKGHETYQIFRDKVIPFDDREVVRKILRERLNATHT